jgi:hypothetical protein
MRILKDSRQYFEVPAVKILPIGSWRGHGHPVKYRPPASESGPSTRTGSPSPARTQAAVTAVLDLDRPVDPAHEIEAALDVALGSGARAHSFELTSGEIARALESVFPRKLCTMPPGATPQAQSADDCVFLISYEEELNCLRNNGSIDRQWTPAGMRPSADRHENR